MGNIAEQFIREYENKVVDLYKKANTAYYDASISGVPEDYKKASDLQLELSKIYSDKNSFLSLKGLKTKNIDDPFVKRQIDVIYNEFAINQFDEELHQKIVELSSKIEERFGTFRATVNDKKMTDNEIDDFLFTSRDSDMLREVWLASKTVGKEVAEDVVKLVKLRNEAAAKIGFDNYHQMSLTLNEQNTEELDRLFDQLDELSAQSYSEVKSEIDQYLSTLYNVPVAELGPWHYQDKFLQQGPKIYSVDYDKYFAETDIIKLTREFFNGINLDVDDIISRSDLFEKENKYQHAYCSDLDRNGDIRILCNIKPNYRWMSTMLHESGHAVYDKYISRNLPWQLRTHAHILATESIAMLFGRMASDPIWINDMLNIGKEEVANILEESHKSLRLEQLIFTRWTQVVYRFEKAMYENPDQDLNSLWWSLVEKYQWIKKPEGRDEPDWAAKIHISLYPVYYHNYMLGELLASQLHYFIKTKVMKENFDSPVSYVNRVETGEYLKHLFFSYGALYSWKDLVLKSTGEDLSPKYYIDQFIRIV